MKTLQNTIVAVALTAFLFSSNLFAQDFASSSALVNIKILKALSIGAVDNSIDFPDYAAAGDGGGTTFVKPGTESAANFIVEGQENQAITVSYDATVTLTHATIAASTLSFTPDVDYSTDNVNNSGDVVNNALHAVNLNGSGEVNLWVGGSIKVLNSSDAGSYQGTFNISVAY